jgi:hypothetical protein
VRAKIEFSKGGNDGWSDVYVFDPGAEGNPVDIGQRFVLPDGVVLEAGVVVFADDIKILESDKPDGFGVSLESREGQDGECILAFDCGVGTPGATLSHGNRVDLWMGFVGQNITVEDCFDVRGCKLRIRVIEDLPNE